ncbi:mutS protein homolog 5-like, partial [Zootermopsis nevadensis]|uniref:mutS protein homolog 5-like n=1 Tax=Zootermopsis nevadensis TaxID=136037 RepID=UPI000B8E9291
MLKTITEEFLPVILKIKFEMLSLLDQLDSESTSHSSGDQSTSRSSNVIHGNETFSQRCVDSTSDPEAGCNTTSSQIPSLCNVTKSFLQSSEIEKEYATTDSKEDMVVLSVFWRRGMLGAAYYNVETSEIHIATDIVDMNPDFNILQSLYHLVEPTCVLVSSQVPESFISVLKTLAGTGSLSESASSRENILPERKLNILPRKDYNFEACRRRIFLLKLPSEPKDCNEEEHLMYLNSLIDMTNESMTHALGVLLKWLDVSWGFLHLDQQTQATVMAVNTISLEDIVMISLETYEALQIFNQVAHPSSFKRGVRGSYREGLSVYGIFNRCKSQLGCKFMRVMFLHPSRDTDLLNSRLDVVQFCVEPKNEEIVKNMLNCLKNIKSITRILSRLTRLSASVREWKSLHKTIYYGIMLGNICEAIVSKAKLFTEIVGCITEEMRQIDYCINRIVDFKEAEVQNTFVVKLGVDEDLDRLKQNCGGIPDLMSSVAQEELNHLPPYIKECALVYIPEIGYLLSLPPWKQPMTENDWNVPGIDFLFKLGTIGHYKTARCQELDGMLGDTMVEIVDYESRILLKLVQFIQERIAPLHKLIKLTSELDCLIALALVAKENNYTRPVLTQERVLEIEGGRHPLQELCVDDFVPNDTFSGDQHSLMKIITGPNSSGKSVYLKQVALIAYLAHIGSFVPAKSSKIGILRHIHTRIQTVESIATNISAFMIDLKQMTQSLYCSTPSSLIIVDEFGKGTTEIDGLALLSSCLDHFLSRGVKCPHVLASTHFHDVVNLVRNSRYLKLQTMEYIADHDGQIINLFKLKE